MQEEKIVLDCGHDKNGEIGYVNLGATKETICQPCWKIRKRAVYSPRVLRRERRPLSAGTSTLMGAMGFAEPSGPCPNCEHDHVAEPRCVRYGDGITIICSVNDCGGRVPIKDPFPILDGNCCDILNMSTENLNESLKRWPGLAVDCEVEIVDLQGSERARVVDSRVPFDWLRHVCESCGVYENR